MLRREVPFPPPVCCCCCCTGGGVYPPGHAAAAHCGAACTHSAIFLATTHPKSCDEAAAARKRGPLMISPRAVAIRISTAPGRYTPLDPRFYAAAVVGIPSRLLLLRWGGRHPGHKKANCCCCCAHGYLNGGMLVGSGPVKYWSWAGDPCLTSLSLVQALR